MPIMKGVEDEGEDYLQMKWYIGAALLLLVALFLQSGLLAYAMYVLFGILLLSRVLARSWIENLSAVRTCKTLSAEIGDPAPRRGRRQELRLAARSVGAAGRSAAPRRPRRAAATSASGEGQAHAGSHARSRRRDDAALSPGIPHARLLPDWPAGAGKRRPLWPAPALPGRAPSRISCWSIRRSCSFEGYDLASRRPIGEVRLSHRLYEDPTRIAGVRPYEAGDPLNRVHWRATARTGTLHSKVYEPSTLAGATLLLDFHRAGYPDAGRAVPLRAGGHGRGLAGSCGLPDGAADRPDHQWQDTSERLRLQGWEGDFRSRLAARKNAGMLEKAERIRPLIVETRRGAEQFQRIREMLARSELVAGSSFAQLVTETADRLPRDATVLAILPDVSVETAIALGTLRRQGYAITVVLILMDSRPLERGYGRLVSEGIRDIRHLRNEESLPSLCQQHLLGPIDGGWSPFADAPPDAKESGPNWAERSAYEWMSSED